MNNTFSAHDVIYSDPRLEFSTGLRFLWKIVVSSIYLISIVGTVLAILSEIEWLHWFGILCALVLIDRAMHINRPLHSMIELKPAELKGINVAEYVMPKTYRAISRAMDKTSIAGGNFYLHLIKLLVHDRGIRGALWRLEVSPEEFEHKIDEEIETYKHQAAPAHKELLKAVDLLVKFAFFEAYASREKYIQLNDLFAAMATVDDAAIRRVFYLFSIDPEDVKKALIFSRYRHQYGFLSAIPQSLGGFVQNRGVRHRVMNRAWTARPTPILDRYSDDLTDLARAERVGFLIGHEQEYRSLVDILSRSAKPNVMLIGEPGSGKESIISHLAFNIVKDTVPDPLFDKRLVSLSISELSSGSDPQELSLRAAAILREILAARNIILYIPDIHNLFKTGGNGYMTVADIFLPAISGDAFQVIGSTYPKEMKQYIEDHPDFAHVFEPIRIEELSEDDAVKLLTYDSIILEKQYNITISFEAVKAAVNIAHKYFKQKLLPSSAEDLLKEALASATQRGEKVLTNDLVIALAERKINVPMHRTTKEEAEKLLNLEAIIHEQLIDQEQAVTAVARSLREYRSGLARSSGPIAAFLFVGPTGVGKTELAKILTKIMFGSEQLMLRFDMSEYQDKQSIYRFIGTPDGKMSGMLTEAVIQKPYSLMLLDEFEKAHPDVLNLFLQVFDDGRITDNVGRVVDFQNTIIIATSNANSDLIKDAIDQGKTIADIKDEFKKKLASYFRPELLNRFSDVIIFKHLSTEDTLAIARMQIGKLVRTLSEEQGIVMEVDEAVIQILAKEGYDPMFGARPLRTVINDRIKSELAEMILRGDVRKGIAMRVILEGDEITFKTVGN